MHFYIHVYFLSIWLSIVSLVSFHLIKIVRICYLLVTNNRILIILWIKKNWLFNVLVLFAQNLQSLSKLSKFITLSCVRVSLSGRTSLCVLTLILLVKSCLKFFAFTLPILSHQSFKMNLISGLFHKATRE